MFYVVLASFQVAEDNQLLAEVLLTSVLLLTQFTEQTSVTGKAAHYGSIQLRSVLCRFQIYFM